jgi:hypothetical protein
MSAIADFRLIEISRLNELKEKAEIKVQRKLFRKIIIDQYWDFLQAHSDRLKDFDWSGYVFADLLVFLAKKHGIQLDQGEYQSIAEEITSKREMGTLILTYDHKRKYMNELSPERFSLEELIAFNKEFSEDDDPELAKAELEGIKALRENLEAIEDDTRVVILSVE